MADRANPDWVWHSDLSLYLNNSFFKNWTKQEQQKNFSCTVSVLFSSSICLWIFLWYWVPLFLLVPCLSLFIYILQILRPLSPKTSWNLDANFIFLLKLILKANRIFCLVYQNGSSSVIFPLCSCWLYIHHDRFQL